jgi:hypothetical protein
VLQLHNDKIDASIGDQQKPEIITFYNLTKGGMIWWIKRVMLSGIRDVGQWSSSTVF